MKMEQAERPPMKMEQAERPPMKMEQAECPPMKMEQAECSETSAYKIQTPVNHPAGSTQHSVHSESFKPKGQILCTVATAEQNSCRSSCCWLKVKILCKCEGKGKYHLTIGH
jgi:hypothetical protein